MKECIACSEDIKESAKLCKHCGTRQDNPEFLPQATEAQSQPEVAQDSIPHADLLIRLVEDYLNYDTTCGPFVEVDEDLARATDPELVWSLGDSSHSYYWVLGFHENPAEGYIKATSPVQEGIPELITNRVYFDCQECSEDETGEENPDCSICAGAGSQFIDIDTVVDLVKQGSIDSSSAAEIWNQRRRGGDGMIWSFGQIISD